MDHCIDCCCARSWKALGITEYTGKSIEDHILEIRAATRQACKAAIREACTTCGGTGIMVCEMRAPGKSVEMECAYCGDPMAAIDALGPPDHIAGERAKVELAEATPCNQVLLDFARNNPPPQEYFDDEIDPFTPNPDEREEGA